MKTKIKYSALIVAGLLVGWQVLDTLALVYSKQYRIDVALKCDKIIQLHPDEDRVDNWQCKKLVKIEKPICEKNKYKEEEDCNSSFNNILRVAYLYEKHPELI